MSDWDARKEVLRKRINTPFPQRIDAVNALAERYRFPDVTQQAMDVLGLRPHRSTYERYAYSEIDVSYEVASGSRTRGVWIWREPYYASRAVEVQEGEFYDLPSENYTTHRTKRFRLFSLELNEDEIIEFKVEDLFSLPTRLGTTATLQGYEDLLAAVKTHIRDHKPLI